MHNSQILFVSSQVNQSQQTPLGWVCALASYNLLSFQDQYINIGSSCLPNLLGYNTLQVKVTPFFTVHLCMVQAVCSAYHSHEAFH